MHWVEAAYGKGTASILCCEACAKAHADGTIEVKVR